MYMYNRYMKLTDTIRTLLTVPRPVWTLTLAAVLALCSCTKDGLTPLPDDDEGRVLELIVNVPATQAGTRAAIGDPGEAVPEGADWDRLAVLVAFMGDPGEVYCTILTQEAFIDLPFVAEGSDARRLSLRFSRTEGKAEVYGITYSSGVGDTLETDIRECTTLAAVRSLTIPNSYAGGNTAKFVSVATGFYQGEGVASTPWATTPGTIDIARLPEVGATLPRMTLYRLAAKVDMQWEASDSYWAGLSEVRVTDVTFRGSNSGNVTGEGSGRLFPSLAGQGATALIGTKTFTNTSEISQRNGRAYHYVFPDGVSTPHVDFHIRATADDGGTQNEGDYTLDFRTPLQQATWYKVNATISGLSGQGSITVDFDD